MSSKKNVVSDPSLLNKNAPPFRPELYPGRQDENCIEFAMSPNRPDNETGQFALPGRKSGTHMDDSLSFSENVVHLIKSDLDPSASTDDGYYVAIYAMDKQQNGDVPYNDMHAIRQFYNPDTGEYGWAQKSSQRGGVSIITDDNGNPVHTPPQELGMYKLLEVIKLPKDGVDTGVSGRLNMLVKNNDPGLCTAVANIQKEIGVFKKLLNDNNMGHVDETGLMSAVLESASLDAQNKIRIQCQVETKLSMTEMMPNALAFDLAQRPPEAQKIILNQIALQKTQQVQTTLENESNIGLG